MNLGRQALQIVNTVAPTIATALGGPVAGLAVKALQDQFGTKTDADTEAAIVGATPDQLAALRKIDTDFKARMAELGFDEEKLRYDDTANARAREMAVRDSTPKQLAWLIIGGFLGISLAQLVAMLGWADQVNKIPSQGWLLIGNISGYLANDAKQAAAYYFGTSAGSQAKDATIAEIAKQ